MKNHSKRGFIKIVILIVGALVLLKYVYNIDVIGFLTAGRFRELLDQFYSLGARGWANYSEIIARIWNYFVEFAKNLLAKIK